jgi:hypothetical protein
MPILCSENKYRDDENKLNRRKLEEKLARF